MTEIERKTKYNPVPIETLPAMIEEFVRTVNARDIPTNQVIMFWNETDGWVEYVKPWQT